MKNSVNVLSTLVCVEFLLYTVCLCAPEWLEQPGGTSEGLFAVCHSYEGFSSCTTFPAWMGSYSLTWVFLASSSVLSLATLVAIRLALTKRKRAIEALLLNIFSVAFCMSALISFMVSMEKQLTEMVKFLGWAFYICCTALFYGSLVSVALGLVQGSSNVGPSDSQNCPGMPAISP